MGLFGNVGLVGEDPSDCDQNRQQPIGSDTFAHLSRRRREHPVEAAEEKYPTGERDEDRPLLDPAVVGLNDRQTRNEQHHTVEVDDRRGAVREAVDIDGFSDTDRDQRRANDPCNPV
jgi:hypothetical protein